MKAAKFTSSVLAVVFVLWVVQAGVVAVRSSARGVPFDFDRMCSDTEFSCAVLAGTLTPVVSLALASTVFLVVRLRHIRRPYMRKAREKPQDLVQTSGRLIDEVVGRDELCHVMIADLRDRRTRRPHVIVGGVGTGKTALLVQMTKLLTQRGAVPVPIRLRDAQDQLDFRKLARDRFLAEAEDALLSADEGERAWRYLYRNNQVVVLADGLEEALNEGGAEKDRDNLIRLAIRRANESRLPLVIASRPHDPLREMEAIIVELEPLSEEAAMQYVQRRDASEDEHRLDWIVETADVAETPLYLQITRQLHRAHLMEYVSPSRERGQLDTRSVDRAELRLRLLDTWTQALIRGYFPPGLALSRDDRAATIVQLSVLACLGLEKDSLYVRFDDVEALQRRSREGEPSPLVETMETELRKLGRGFDIRLAATWGAQLGLVETRGEGVRFPHSIMQAYLGSRLIHSAMADPQYRSEALDKPGRELLIALVMHSRAKVKQARPNGAVQVRIRDDAQRLQHLLWQKAGNRSDVKALDLYAAAFEIDSVDKAPAHAAIADELQARWDKLGARDPRTLEEAKLNLVHRLGDAARTIAEQGRSATDYPAEPAYLQLYHISFLESSYPIRLATAQEIGAGDDEAFDALKGLLGPHDPLSSPPEPSADPLQDADQAEENRSWRESVSRAWLAPLLVGSVTERRDPARRNLEQWLQFVGSKGRLTGEQDRTPATLGLRLSLEIALAQGFKHAANRRSRHPHAHPEARVYLAEQAREMLKAADHWFTRLTLLHALCLWSLPDSPSERSPARARDANLKALVEHWVALPDGSAEHPFVAEARNLAVWALETGQPERFIWIDESGVVGRIGSRSASPGARRKHNLWIPPSTGWTALHPRAQQLVADVLLLLNLAERGQRPSDRDRRLQRTDRHDLPPCLAGDRSPLDPLRTVGMVDTSEPGSNCKDGCRFELCPYPPKGQQSYRVELSEAFCRRQQALVNGGSVRRKAAPWQAALPGHLRRFWRQMGQRTQPSELERDRVAYQRR